MIQKICTVLLFLILGFSPAVATQHVYYTAGFPASTSYGGGPIRSINNFGRTQNYQRIHHTHAPKRVYARPYNYGYGYRYRTSSQVMLKQTPVIVNNNIITEPAKVDKTYTPVKTKTTYTRNGITYYN